MGFIRASLRPWCKQLVCLPRSYLRFTPLLLMGSCFELGVASLDKVVSSRIYSTIIQIFTNIRQEGKGTREITLHQGLIKFISSELITDNRSRRDIRKGYIILLSARGLIRDNAAWCTHPAQGDLGKGRVKIFKLRGPCFHTFPRIKSKYWLSI